MKRAAMYDLPTFDFQECRLKEIVLNSDLRNGHEGLIALAKSKKATLPTELRQGEILVFLNTEQNAFKAMIGGEAAMFHFREPRRHKIHHKVLFNIPRWFRGGPAAYSQELFKILEREVRA